MSVAVADPEYRSSRLRLLPAPTWPTDVRPSGPTPGPGQQPLPLEFCLPNGLPAVPPVPPLRTQPAGPSVMPWAARLAQAVLEVSAGERPVLQLMSWVSPEIYRRLERRHRLSSAGRDPRHPAGRKAAVVRSVHVCHPTDDVAEVAVVTSDAQRSLALAMRLERRRGRWFCAELDWA